MDENARLARVETVTVVYRVTPAHKNRLTFALR